MFGLVVSLLVSAAVFAEDTNDGAPAVPAVSGDSSSSTGAVEGAAIKQDSAATILKSAPATKGRGSEPSTESKTSTDSKSADNQGPFAGLQLSGEKGPIDIKSDALDLDYKANQVLFHGHVKAKQGTALLDSNTLRVSYGENFKQVKQIIAQGNVKITQGGRWATGEQAVLNQIERTVVMTGNPVVHDGPDQIAGDKITIYLDSQKSVVEGARAVIFPRSSETRDNETAANNHGS